MGYYVMPKYIFFSILINYVLWIIVVTRIVPSLCTKFEWKYILLVSILSKWIYLCSCLFGIMYHCFILLFRNFSGAILRLIIFSWYLQLLVLLLLFSNIVVFKIKNSEKKRVKKRHRYQRRKVLLQVSIINVRCWS